MIEVIIERDLYWSKESKKEKEIPGNERLVNKEVLLFISTRYSKIIWLKEPVLRATCIREKNWEINWKNAKVIGYDLIIV